MATTKAQSLPGGIIKLTKLLEHLNKSPKLTLTNTVKGIRLTLAYQNDHWGARHFVKEDLPRIRYANPDLEIDIVKWRKEQNDHWRPELEVKFDNGQVKVVDMDAKPSSTILKELMSVAGGHPWKTHVEEATKAGNPIVPDEPLDNKPVDQAAQKKGARPPNLWEFRKANPQKENKAEQARKEREERKSQKQKGQLAKRESTGIEVDPVSQVDLSISESTPSTPSPASPAS